MADLVAGIHDANRDTVVFYHTDGNIEPVIEDLIEIGVDVLNPVQRECMDILALKKQYGDRLSFWGGVGVQSTLPFGSPEDVRREVREIMEGAGRGGGLVIAPGHVIEPDVPWENVEAFVAAVREYNHGRP